MSDARNLTILAPIKDTLDLIDAIRDKWRNDTLQSGEQCALNLWRQGARVAIHNYLLLLDNSETDSDPKTLRIFKHGMGDNYDSLERDDIITKKRFPRQAYERIISYLRGILEDCENGHYQYPSALPLFMNDDRRFREFQEPGINIKPSLAFLTVDFYLDWIGIGLFGWHAEGTDRDYWHHTFATSDIAAYLVNNEWRTLRSKVAGALKAAWPSHGSDIDKQSVVINDLRRLRFGVDKGQAKTVLGFEKYIREQLAGAPRSRRHFHDETKKLLLASVSFNSEVDHHSESPHATSHSLGSSLNKFSPQARSLFSHRF